MKIRTGHVSNSSSSSFVISKSALSPAQIKNIETHGHYASTHYHDEYFNCDEPWSIEVGEHVVRGSTLMDNFDMEKFLELIGVDYLDVNWNY